jgi:hypothetical protein
MKVLLRLYCETLGESIKIPKRRRRIIDEWFALPENVKWDTIRYCAKKLINDPAVPHFEVATLYFGDETSDGWAIDIWCQISMRETPLKAIHCYWMGKTNRDLIKQALQEAG